MDVKVEYCDIMRCLLGGEIREEPWTYLYTRLDFEAVLERKEERGC